ncbi:Nn.00g090020.m01.CDS01 [Neocucurbitaria sp. VM-36]
MSNKREKRKNARRIDPDIWAEHRSEIERLYVDEERSLKRANGKDGVIEIMRERHKFTATEPQYEAQLKKWRIRKKIKQKQWLVILRTIQRRASLHKYSRVKFRGAVIGQERILREESRYRSKLEARNTETYELSPRHLEDIEVYTPCSDLDTCDMVESTGNHRPNPGIVSNDRQLRQATTHSHVRNNVQLSVSFISYLDSLSWMKTLNWTEFTQAVPRERQLAKWSAPALDQFNATFYPIEAASTALMCQDTNSAISRYLIFSTINNMGPSASTNVNDLYCWLRCIPTAVVLGVFAALPGPIFEVFREKVFAAAVEAKDLEIVQLMLKLDVDPRDRIMIANKHESESMQPLWSILTAPEHPQGVSVAKAIMFHILDMVPRADPDDLLSEIIHAFRLGESSTSSYSDAQRLELLLVPISYGARPTVACFSIIRTDAHVARELAKLHKNGSQGWLKAGLIEKCVFWRNHRLHSWILSYLLDEEAHHIRSNDLRTVDALSKAFHAALENSNESTVKVILETCTKHGMILHYSEYGNSAIQIKQSCLEGDFQTAVLLVSAHRKAQRERIFGGLIKKGKRDVRVQQFEQRLSAVDLDWINNRLEHDEVEDTELLTDYFMIAVRLRYDDIALKIVRLSEFYCFDSGTLLEILKYGKVAVVSAFICADYEWREALDCGNRAGAERSFMSLEDLLYRQQIFSSEDGIFPGNLFVDSTSGEQIALRALSYHAIYTNDYDLLGWLLQMGLVIDELRYIIDINTRKPVLRKASRRLEAKRAEKKDGHLPSLLVIATARCDKRLLQFLLAERAENLDIDALMTAVDCKEGPEILDMLLDAAENRPPSFRKQYGSEALRESIREAIRRKEYTILCTLAARIDVTSVDLVFADEVDVQATTSALGEAIERHDTKAAQILLENGADPNALVSHSGINVDEPKGTKLQRLSPLLAAIDKQDLSMITLLIKGGAEPDCTPSLGLLRTPLQRAAEIGNFEMVRYFIGQGALVDRAPVYGGGTALQLAAMGGYTGIATLLLEHGADPNHAPAEGPGQTAFVWAAEQGHVNMVTLLLRAGVDLNRKFNELPAFTQCEWAIILANERGHCALGRMIRELHRQYTQHDVARRWYGGSSFSFTMRC